MEGPSASASAPPSWIDAKIASYEAFLNERLKVDLEAVHDERDKLYERISEWCAPNPWPTHRTLPRVAHARAAFPVPQPRAPQQHEADD